MIRLENLGGLNKKGVAGKIITSFPVMILIFFIIAIYIISAAVLYKVKGAPSSLAIEGVELDNVLLKEIMIGEKRALLIDGLVQDYTYNYELKKLGEKVRSGGASEEERKRYDKLGEIYQASYFNSLREGIKNVMKREKGFDDRALCFIAFFNRGNPISQNFIRSRDIYFVANRGDVKEGPTFDLERYYDKEMLRIFEYDIKSKSFEGKDIRFVMQYYYGRCLEEGV